VPLASVGDGRLASASRADFAQAAAPSSPPRATSKRSTSCPATSPGTTTTSPPPQRSPAPRRDLPVFTPRAPPSVTASSVPEQFGSRAVAVDAAIRAEPSPTRTVTCPPDRPAHPCPRWCCRSLARVGVISAADRPQIRPRHRRPRRRRAKLIGTTPSPPRASPPMPSSGEWGTDRGSLANQRYGNAVNASVNSATRASSCTSAEDDTSSSEPSSARAASPALLSISSAILASMVWAAMIRHAVTGSV
jgi:hypothetical protein